MQISKLSLGLAALALVAAPTIAQASMATAAAAAQDGEVGGDAEGIILGLLGGAAVIGAIVVASDNDDPTLPVSN